MRKLNTEKHFFSFSARNEPALTVSSGTIVEVETMDCFSNQIQTPDDTFDALDWSRVNPATGPIFVEEAEEGDTLKIEIMDISIAERGIMVAGENEGILGHLLKGIRIKFIPIRESKAIFDSKVSIPLRKMIGVIGVAPKEGEINCGTPGSHGGNMDNLMITTGATLYFPIFVKGALFGLGDLHAAMGDGEIGVSGIEVAGKVKLRIEVIKNLKISDPMLSNSSYLSTMASEETLDKAVAKATENMAVILKDRLPLGLHEIAMLMSATGETQICQVVDPFKTARFLMPNWVLDAYEFKLN